MCTQDYIFLQPIPHKHILAPCMVNFTSIFVLIFTCLTWVEKIKKQMWMTAKWHLDGSPVAASPALSWDAQKDKNAHHSSEQQDCETAYCQGRGLLPVGTAEMEGKKKDFLCLSQSLPFTETHGLVQPKCWVLLLLFPRVCLLWRQPQSCFCSPSLPSGSTNLNNFPKPKREGPFFYV